MNALNLQAALTYLDVAIDSKKASCVHDEPVSYNAIIKNTGNAPIYNISFYDATTGQTQTIAKLEINESTTITDLNEE